jgi:hypothetical protein
MKTTTPVRVFRIVLFILALYVMNANAQTLMTGMPVPDGSVYAFEKDGNTIYIGGFFTEVDAVAHVGLARFDAVTGVTDSWNPAVDNNGVTCLAIAAGKLIAGGSFLEINGQSRLGIGMFDLASGNLESWSDTANFMSWRMGIGADSNLFYYGHLVNGFMTRIVCVNASTGTFTSWQSDSLINGNTNAILVSDGYVYVGGQFTFSAPSQYDNLCRFDQITGALDTSWHPYPIVNNFGVTAIVKTNDQVFVGGDFNTIAGQSREGVAAFDAAGNLTAFNQNSSSYEVLSLYADGDYIWVGGNSSTLGSQLRYRIAQISISNYTATCWNASSTTSTWSTVQAILVKGDTVYAGPFGSPSLAVFNQSPLPLQGSAITGPSAVLPSSTETYSVPLVAGNSYSWIVTGGTGSSTTNTINVTWGPGPNGSVALTENNPSGGNCSAHTSLQVSISANVNVKDPLGLTAMYVFPNPSEGTFTLTTTEASQKQLSVFDIIGNEILKINSGEKTVALDLSKMTPGLYFLKIETDKVVRTEKLLKR